MPYQPQDQLSIAALDPLHGRRFVVRKRDGRLDEFNEARILLAIESAFRAVAGLERDARLPDSAQSAARHCADVVTARILGRAVKGEELEVEQIQDSVEAQLMAAGHVDVARGYILYREERRQVRAVREKRFVPRPPPEDSHRARLTRELYRQAPSFSVSINEGEFLRLVAPEMLDFDVDALARHLRPERDELLPFSGLQELCDHYLLREGVRIIETPQQFWMRIAMGLALHEGERAEARAVEFYEVLSTLRFLPSAAILRHAGSPLPRLAVCYAVSSAGGVEQIKAPSGEVCVWLEPWHFDIFGFLLPTPTAQDLTKGFWLPDLFLKRVREEKSWTLFNPAETPDLHHLHGSAFEDRYLHYEQRARDGQLEFSRVVEAGVLWHGIMDCVRKGGQVVIGFKDAVHARCPQPLRVCHAAFGDGFLAGAAGVSGAINLPLFLTGHATNPLDLPLLRATITTSLRMLDNALALSAYPSPAAREAALQNRCLALGLHGFDDALDPLGVNYSSYDTPELADRSAEALAWCGALASADLAAERGPCAGFATSKWGQGMTPLDTLFELERQRGSKGSLDHSTAMDWQTVRQAILRHGLRHSAITAFVADPSAAIAGIHSSAEPSPYAGLSLPGLVECAARRQKWIDMGQSFSFHCDDPSIEDLSRCYLLAWEKGLKTIRPLTIVKHNIEPAKPSPAVAPTSSHTLKGT